MRGIRRLQCALLATAMIVAVGASAQAPKPRSYVLATATTGGTYYPVGVAVATLVKVKLQPKQKLDMSAISSAGSGENVKLLREKQAQFAILQGLFGMYARQGSGSLKADGPQKNIRSVTMLWPNVEHFVITADLAKTGTVDDLKNLVGKKFAIGARNSGTEHSNRFLLHNLGIEPETLDLAYLGFGPSIDALQNGSVLGTNPGAGPPVAVITRAMAQMGNRIRLLEFTPEQAVKADGGNDLYNPFVVPAGTYPGQTKDFHTVAQPNFLGVNADVPEADVYLITKTIYQNLAFLNNIHAATKSMSLKVAIAGLPLPLHPGAARYYKEAGLTVPDRLMAK